MAERMQPGNHQVPTLSELCARVMLDDPFIDAEMKLQVLEKLKKMSKSRAKKFEREQASFAYGDSNVSDEEEDYEDDGYDSDRFQENADFWDREGKHSEEKKSDHNSKPQTEEKESYDNSDNDNDNNNNDDDDDDDERFELEQAIKYKQAAEEARIRRKQSKMAFEWKQRFTQLEHKGQVLDRERMAILRMARGHLEKETAEFDRFEAELDHKRRKDRRDLENQVDKAKWAVQRLKATVEEMGSGDAYLATIQQQMEHAESSISSIKSSHRKIFQELLKCEQTYTLELEQIKEKIDNEVEQDKIAAKRLLQETRKSHMSNTVANKDTVKPVVSTKRSPRYRDVNKEGLTLKDKIAAIDEEIAEIGGLNGNWDDRDHAQFLRYVSKLKISDSVLIRNAEKKKSDYHRNSPINLIKKLVTKASLDIPTKDEQAVLAHVIWYGTYLSLLNEKKQLVKTWKEERKSHSGNRMRSSNQDENEPNINKERYHRSEGKQQESKKKLLETRRRDQQEKKRAVAEWKAAKESERRRMQAAKEAEERAERDKRSELALRRRKEREQIALFKLEKEAEADRRKKFQQVLDEEKRKSDARNAKASSTMSLKERQKQSLEHAARRRAALREKHESEEDRATRIAKLKARPAIRPGFEQTLRHRSGDALTQPTTACKTKSITPEELGEIQERRSRARAHDITVPSAAAAGMGGRSYAIGVKNLVSGRSAASWRR